MEYVNALEQSNDSDYDELARAIGLQRLDGCSDQDSRDVDRRQAEQVSIANASEDAKPNAKSLMLATKVCEELNACRSEVAAQLAAHTSQLATVEVLANEVEELIKDAEVDAGNQEEEMCEKLRTCQSEVTAYLAGQGSQLAAVEALASRAGSLLNEANEAADEKEDVGICPRPPSTHRPVRHLRPSSEVNLHRRMSPSPPPQRRVGNSIAAYRRPRQAISPATPPVPTAASAAASRAAARAQSEAKVSSKEASPSLPPSPHSSSCMSRPQMQIAPETKFRGYHSVKNESEMDIPRLIWQLERHHASETGRTQAELRSLWREFSELRERMSSVLDVTQRGVVASNVMAQNVETVTPASAVPPAITKEVEQLRGEVHGLNQRSLGAERSARVATEAVAALREEVRRCAAEATASASSARLAANSLRSQQITEGSAAQDDAASSFEQRLRAIEDFQVNWSGSPREREAKAEESFGTEVRAQLAALERQVGHLRDVSADAGRTAEQDQSALRALLRASRLLAERLGVGPVLLGRETAGSLVAEAESLAAGVAASWRKQKASGIIPAGAANILEAMRMQRTESGSANSKAFFSDSSDSKVAAGMPMIGSDSACYSRSFPLLDPAVLSPERTFYQGAEHPLVAS